MQAERAIVGLGFWLRWMLAAITGTIGQALLSIGIGLALEAAGVATSQISPVVPGAVNGVLAGVVVGTAQWLILRRHIIRAGGWIPASIVGWVAFWVIIQAVIDPLSKTNEWVRSIPATLVGGALLGVLLGLPQWFVLRRQVGRAGWCVLISSLGMAISISLGTNLPGSGFVTLMAGLIVYQALIGLGMVWLLRQPAPQSAHRTAAVA